MEAIILSGGFAKRLLPISEFIPKPLLPLGGKPILDHILSRIIPLNVNTVFLSVNKRFSDQFEYYASRRNDVRIEVIVEPTNSEEEKLGAIRGLRYALLHIRKDDFLVVAGDNYFDFDLRSMHDFFKDKCKTTVAVYDVENKDIAKKYGVVGIDNEFRILEFREKPAVPKTTLVSTGIYMFKNDLPEVIDEYLNTGKNPDQLGHLLEWIIDRDTVYGYPFKGKWYDIGTIETYREIFNMFL